MSPTITTPLIFVTATLALTVLVQAVLLIANRRERERLGEAVYRHNRCMGIHVEEGNVLDAIARSIYGENVPRYPDGSRIRLGDVVEVRDPATGQVRRAGVIVNIVIDRNGTRWLDRTEPLALSLDGDTLPLGQALRRYPFLAHLKSTDACVPYRFHDEALEAAFDRAARRSAVRGIVSGVLSGNKSHIAWGCAALHKYNEHPSLTLLLEKIYFEGRVVTAKYAASLSGEDPEDY